MWGGAQEHDAGRQGYLRESTGQTQARYPDAASATRCPSGFGL